MKYEGRWPQLLTPLVLAHVLVLSVVSGCAGSSGFGPLGGGVPSDQRAAYESAMSHMPDDPAATEAALKRFLKAHPESRLADDAAEEIARMSLIQGNRDDAFEWLYMVVEKYPQSDRVDPVRVRLARWEYERGDGEQAQRLLDPVRTGRLKDSDERSLYRLLANLALDPVEKLVQLSHLREATEHAYRKRARSPNDSEATEKLAVQLDDQDAEIDALLLAMNNIDLLRALSDLRSRVPAGRLRLMLARRALEAGNFKGAQRYIDDAQRHRLTPTDEQRVASLELRLGLSNDIGTGVFLPSFAEAASRTWPDLGDARGTLGVVLPLSGRYAVFGQKALRGVMLAARVFDRPAVDIEHVATRGSRTRTLAIDELPVVDAQLEPDPRVRLIVRDSQGSAELAAAAVRELAAMDDVVAIVGPIFSSECEAAAREAEREDIPLLTLSNRSEISSERDWVFRLRTTPEDEVGFLVDYAVDELGAEKFAVLYPKSRYGRGMRTRYWQAVEARGGQIVAASSYESDATDMSDAIRSMIGYSLLTPNERVALQERDQALRRGRRFEPEDAALLRQVLYDMLGPEAEPLPPIVDFDALFIPDGYDKIQLIAPQLALHEIVDVSLLGSSEWNDPNLLKVGARHMRGAVISTTFDRDSKYEIVRDYVAAFRESFGSEPDGFSSGAYDATSIALTQLVGGSETRQQVRDGILRVHGYPGVSGVTSIQTDGNARKRPFLLGIERGRMVSLD